MKVDSKKVQQALKQIPKTQRSYLFKAVRKSQQEAERLMKTMAPSGSFASMIYTQAERTQYGIRASVEAAPSNIPDQVKVLSVEFGRSNSGVRRQPDIDGEADRGTTDAFPYVRRTAAIIARKHKGRITRAMNKAAKEVGFK